MSKLLLWYHEPSDQLGLGHLEWQYLVLVKFVPFTKHRCDRFADDTEPNKSPVDYIEHPIAQEITADWVVIGEL